MTTRIEVFRRSITYALLGVLGAGIPLAVEAQSCPLGYYYASDGNCYPGPPPNYPPPVYDTAPPVSAPPVVMDGLLIGLGVLVGGIIASDHGDHFRGRPEAHRPPPRRAPPEPRGPYEHERR